MYNYKQKDTNKNNITSKKKLFFTILTLLIILLITGFIIYKKRSKNTTTAIGMETIVYKEATKEERGQAEAVKDEIIKKQETLNNNSAVTPSTQKKPVKPTITNTVGSINAYVNDIFEEGGECTATFTKNDTTLSRTSKGFQNVSYTQCAPVNLEPGYLSQGSWSVTVKYSSEKSEGISDSQIIEVK